MKKIDSLMLMPKKLMSNGTSSPWVESLGTVGQVHLQVDQCDYCAIKRTLLEKWVVVPVGNRL